MFITLKSYQITIESWFVIPCSITIKITQASNIILYYIISYYIILYYIILYYIIYYIILYYIILYYIILYYIILYYIYIWYIYIYIYMMIYIYMIYTYILYTYIWICIYIYMVQSTITLPYPPITLPSWRSKSSPENGASSHPPRPQTRRLRNPAGRRWGGGRQLGSHWNWRTWKMTCQGA